jgi:hypothetical protein
MKINAAGKLALAAWALAFAAAPLVRAEDAGLNSNNVVIVLDSSGSMSGIMTDRRTAKMDAAKQSLNQVLGQVPADTNIGLLVMSGKNMRDDWVYPLGPRDNQKLAAAINLPQPSGSTPLGVYIKKAADRLLEQRSQQHGYGSYRLLIVTDGEAQDQNLVDKYTPEAIARGIVIDVIGVNMKGDHTLATKVHSYRRADDPAGLHKALADVFAEVASVASDAAGDDAFAQIAPLPDEVAAAMLKALAKTGNQPLGEKAPVKPSDESPPTPVPSAAGGAAPSTPPPPAGPPAADKTAPSPKPKSKSSCPIGAILGVGVVSIKVLQSRSARRKKA